jgi:hypothetical protein
VNRPPVIINNLPPTVVVIRSGFRVNIPMIPVNADPVVIERVRTNLVCERDRCVDEVTRLQQQVDESPDGDQSDLLAQIDQLRQAVQDLESRLQQVNDQTGRAPESSDNSAEPTDSGRSNDDTAPATPGAN